MDGPGSSATELAEQALQQVPGQAALRLHLAGLYASDGRWLECLGHSEVVLTADPTNLDAMGLAAEACRHEGHAQRAEGYRRLLDVLSLDGGREPTPGPEKRQPADRQPDQGVPTDAAGNAAVPVAAEASGELDAFLEEVLSAGDPAVARAVTLADVGGLTAVKRRLQTSFLGPMKNPELRRLYGKSLRGGLLLYGPPGCGKTFLARAVAGELGAQFVGIGLHDVLDMYLGNSERNLHELFQTARRHAPSVLFIDEVDALGMKRSNLTRSAGRNVVVQLLNELDSVSSNNDGVFVLGATNQPWDLDPALRRPGRFDRMLLVVPPDREAREAILRYQLRGRPVHEEVNLVALANNTDGYSGADLQLLCESAAEMALEESVISGRTRPIMMSDLERARTEVRPSTELWLEMARNYAMYANQGGSYDDLLAYLRDRGLG